MTIVLGIWLALAAVLGVVAWKTIDLVIGLLNGRTDELKAQDGLLEEYYDLSARFLRLSDAELHTRARSTIAMLPEAMEKGSLAKAVFVLHRSKRKIANTKDLETAQKELDSMTDETATVFGRALGCALVASTYDMAFLGGFVRRGLINGLDEETHEVGLPDQVAARLNPLIEKNCPQTA